MFKPFELIFSKALKIRICHTVIFFFKTGHRFQQKFDFGLASLAILYAYPEDSGTYECRAINRLGTNKVQTQLRCSGKDTLRVILYFLYE